jgi:hypothetical protein
MPSPSLCKLYGKLARTFRGTAIWHDAADGAPFALMNDHEAEHFIGYVYDQLYHEFVEKRCKTCMRSFTEWQAKKNPASVEPGLSSGRAV